MVLGAGLLLYVGVIKGAGAGGKRGWLNEPRAP